MQGFKRVITLFVFISLSSMILHGCGSKQKWGQDLNPEKKWWVKEGHSWDAGKKIFMAIGYSNPEWEDHNAKRKSADLNASAEAAKFMQQLVSTYMREANYHNYHVNEEIVSASSRETLIGSVVIARKYLKKEDEYRSLLKVDLNYFFNHLKKRVLDNERERAGHTYKQMSPEQTEARIASHLSEIEAKLKTIETQTLEKTFPE